MNNTTHSNVITSNSLKDKLISFTHKVLLALLSGLLLSLAFLNHDYFYYAWIGYIPLLFAIEKTTLLQSYLIGLVTGLTLFTTTAYWVVDFIAISKDYGVHSGFLLSALYWLYSAQLIALATLLFNWLRQRVKVHEFILFPLSIVVFTSSFPMLFILRLGDTQVNFHVALQGIEFIGVHGLDAIIILFNIVLYRALTYLFPSGPKSAVQSKLPFIISVSLIGLWFLYGTMAYSSWQTKIATWDTVKVGIVQVNEVPKLGDRIHYPGYSQAYPPEMEMTERLSSAGADVIIWPEAQSKRYLDDNTVKQAYERRMKSLDNYLVFQDMQHIRDVITGEIIKEYNSAIMINANGEQVDTYQKMKRIPFGEYIPILEKDSLLSQWTQSFFGNFTSGLSKGEQHQTFKHEKINIIPLICYETTFAEFVGEAVNHTSALRNPNVGTVLVGLTNDGWFGSTHLPYQHIMPSVLRAVENRLPLVHVANNGPSIVATPDGNIIFTSEFQQSAGYIVDVPNSSDAQGSFYSQYPSLFNNITRFLFLLIFIYSLASSNRKLKT